MMTDNYDSWQDPAADNNGGMHHVLDQSTSTDIDDIDHSRHSHRNLRKNIENEEVSRNF